MKEFIKKNAKMYMILSMCLLIGAIGVSYAFYSATVSNSTEVVGIAGGGELPLLTISRISTEANGNLIPIDMDTDTLTKAASRTSKCVDNNGYTACQIYQVTVQNNGNIDQIFNINLTSLSGENTPNVDAVTMGTSNNSVTDASSIKNNGLICTTNKVSAGETTTACYFMVIIKNLNTAQSDSGTFGGTVTITSTAGAELKADFGTAGSNFNTLINYIRNKYVSGTPELITHSGRSDTYYYSYQDSSQTWGLMNDGFTIDTTQDATTIGHAKVVTDTTALTTGTQGNIRYFGPSDSVNNYIYFNCSDYSNQSLTDANGNKNCELWRIIGIVDGKVKIIKDESIGDLAWDQDKNQDSSLDTYLNNWQTSSLQLFLNGLYYNRGTTESHTYYSGSSGTTTTTLDLTTIGITSATRTNNLISETTWYLGGYSTSSGLYPNNIYNYERQNLVGTTIYSGNPYTLNANIGLMYSSDYGYGTDLSKCSKDIYNYQNSANTYACRANNWLFNSASQWLITSGSWYPDNAWNVNSTGRVDPGSVRDAYGVRPVLYLNSELAIESEGEGTSTNPYRISVS